MDDSFELPVTYKGTELLLPATLHQLGYTHRFEVLVQDTVVYFERDEEGAYRAIVTVVENNKQLDGALLQAVAESIEAVLK